MYRKCEDCGTITDDMSVCFCPECNARSAVELEQGDYVDRFEIIRKLPGGGMATVYEATHPSGQRRVALKVAHDKPYEYEALHIEAEVLSQLKHPNIVEMIPLPSRTAGKDEYVAKTYVGGEPKCYICLEYVDGCSLRELLKHKDQLKPGEVIPIIEDVGAALIYAHQKGDVHLDVKPSNILLRRDGTAVLTDFGIVRRLDGTRRSCGKRTFGAPRYMSPEHISNRKVDERSDIFSLGVVLYEMLTGRTPFAEETTGHTLSAILRLDPPSPSEITSNVSPRLESVILKALAKDKRDRFQSVQEMVDALKRAVRPVGPPIPLWLAPIGLVALLGVIGLMLLTKGCGEPEPSVLPSPVTVTQELSTVSADAPGMEASSREIRVIEAQSTAMISPTMTVTATATLLPELIATATPTATSTPEPVGPWLVTPEEGHTYGNPITFRWRGVLGEDQRYFVHLRHYNSGHTVRSPRLTGRSWTFELPIKKHGDWRWKVFVYENGDFAAVSSERMFWFKPRP